MRGRVDGESAWERPPDSTAAMLAEGEIFLAVGGVAFFGRGLSVLNRSSNVDASEATELEAPGEDEGSVDDDADAVRSCVDNEAD